MQINLYTLEELSRYVGQPIILAKNDLTISGILYVANDTPTGAFWVEITDQPGTSGPFGILVTQDDLSSGLVSISTYKEVLPINPSALIYIHAVTGKSAVGITDTQLATPHSYSQSSGYWVPITGTRKTPVKADDITDFEVISLPKPSVHIIKEAFKPKSKPEAKPLPTPEHLQQFPYITQMAEKMGIRTYDDGTVTLGSARFSIEDLQSSPLFGTLFTDQNLLSKLAPRMEELYRKASEKDTK